MSNEGSINDKEIERDKCVNGERRRYPDGSPQSPIFKQISIYYYYYITAWSIKIKYRERDLLLDLSDKIGKEISIKEIKHNVSQIVWHSYKTPDIYEYIDEIHFYDFDDCHKAEDLCKTYLSAYGWDCWHRVGYKHYHISLFRKRDFDKEKLIDDARDQSIQEIKLRRQKELETKKEAHQLYLQQMVIENESAETQRLKDREENRKKEIEVDMQAKFRQKRIEEIENTIGGFTKDRSLLYHKSYGSGTFVDFNQDKTIIIIKFESELTETKFSYPDAIGKYLFFERQ